MEKPNALKLLLQRKLEAQRMGSRAGILSDSDLARSFRVGEKPQPKIRRGGRNGSGKP